MRFAILVLSLLLALAGPSAAASDFACVTTYLADTAYQPAPGSEEPAILESAAFLRQRLDLADRLPELSSETVDQWCQFIASPEGEFLRAVAALQLYPIRLEGLEEIDDGVGPMPFDFRKYTLATRYDGLECGYVVAGPLHKAEGQFSIDGGHFRFHDGKWQIGPGASLDVFDRFNVAITEQGALVGKLPLYLNVVAEGEVAQETHTVALNGKQGLLGQTVPVGSVDLPVDVNAQLKFHVVNCWPPGEAPPDQYAFDFSKFKVDETIDKVTCTVEMTHVENPPAGPIGIVLMDFNKGFGSFGFGSYSNGNPSSAFRTANLAVTKDRRLVGILDLWWMYQEPGKVKPPALIVLSGKEGKLDKASLKGTLTVTDDDADSKSTLTIARCNIP